MPTGGLPAFPAVAVGIGVIGESNLCLIIRALVIGLRGTVRLIRLNALRLHGLRVGIAFLSRSLWLYWSVPATIRLHLVESPNLKIRYRTL